MEVKDYAQHVAAEVAWYLRNGRFGRNRVRQDRSGNDYVIGDWSWNRCREYKHQEFVESAMDRGIRGMQ